MVMKKKSIIIGILIIVTIIFFPYLLNSPPGRKVILSRLSKNINHFLEADKTYFSWVGPQRAKGLTAISPSGIQYKFPEISLDMPLWEFYKKIPSIGITRIFHPTVIIPQINRESDIPNKSLDPMIVTQKKYSLPKSCKVFGEVLVSDGKVRLSKWENWIYIPKLQYICNHHGMILHADAKFSSTASLSHVDIECGTPLQIFDVQAREVPTDLLDFFLDLWSEISLKDILGSTVNIDSNAQLINKTGPISLNLHSPRVSLSQSGTLHPEHYLLDKPLAITMQVSDRIVHSIFHHSPLQIDPIQRPITITIGPQEIDLPLSPSTQIKDGLIHIGKITCTNKNLLFDLTAQILGIPDSKIDLCVCDIPFCYVDGILRISRFEIVLQNKYPLAMWGKIDYFQKKVNLTLALTESTLRKAFGITSLPPNYVITCPIKGSFDDIQLDIGKLVKRLSILLAKEKSKKQLWKEGTNFFKEPTISPPPVQSIPWDK